MSFAGSSVRCFGMVGTGRAIGTSAHVNAEISHDDSCAVRLLGSKELSQNKLDDFLLTRSCKYCLLYE